MIDNFFQYWILDKIKHKVAEKALDKLKKEFPVIQIEFVKIGDFLLTEQVRVKIKETDLVSDNYINVPEIQDRYTELLDIEIVNEIKRIINKLIKEG